MTPGARIAAAIEILDDIGAGKPAEQALTGWARRSRFAGSGDRAAIRDHVFQALRCWRSYAALGGAESGRAVMIGAMRAVGADVEALFTGIGHAPAALSQAETEAGRAPNPGAEALDMPDWIWQRFEASLEAQAEAAAGALRTRAPVMLRVNSNISNGAQSIDILQEDDIEARISLIADTALEVTNRARRVAQSRAYHEGYVELQDGSSQAAMAQIPVPADGRVLDYCAGGGGKVLALAARTQAQWFAFDVDAGRMKDLPERATRAGAEVAVLSPDELKAQESFELILCDVPCSGSGTWRRAPEAKWRLTPERLGELQDAQAEILAKAAALLTPSGLLAYTTCSVLVEENEAQILRFLDENQGWRRVHEQRWPIGPDGDGFYLALLSRE